MRIHSLSSEVINQIAAGEVVERPAFVVKELVENCLDAKATEVDIEFDNGGRFIRVTDNGVGIHPDDMNLVVARHATSKISTSADLWQIHTFGFRGEALSSIASISQMILTSRQEVQKDGFRVVSEFGQISHVHSIPHPVGTVVQVEELFKNTPARLKFLKTQAAEFSQIKSVCRAMALSQPQVSFKIRSQGGQLISYWPGQEDRLRRAEQIFDLKLYKAELNTNSIQVEIAYASPSHTTRSSRSIHLFVQNRWVQDPALMKAVLEAFRSLLMHGQYPQCVVWVNCSPHEVDVNVHPTKSQVKFAQPQNLFRAVHNALRNSLEKAPWMEGVFLSRGPAEGAARADRELNQSLTPYCSGTPDLGPHPDSYSRPGFSVDPSDKAQFVSKNFGPIKHHQSRDGNRTQLQQTHFFDSPQDHKSESKAELFNPRWSRLQIIGQAQLTYILAQSDDKLIFVDQHAAHERVLYERLMQSWKEGYSDIQNFLIPLVIDLESHVAEALLKNAGDLDRLGIAISSAGSGSVAVTSAPSMLQDSSIAKALTQLGQDCFELGQGFSFEKAVTDVFATMACHSAVRAGQSQSIVQMQELFAQMDEFTLSCYCPHGRPVFVEYPFRQLERELGRVT